MSADLSPPRLTRRHALIGAAALLAPLPRFALAMPSPTAEKPGLIKLNGNENPYGPSPAARQAILASASAAPRYADESIETLTNQLAAHEGVPASQIVIGTGSGEILRIAGLLAATTTPNSELIASRPTYEELPAFAELLGIKVRWVAPDAGHRHDLPAMRAAITDVTRLVYVCNPNNPTGAAVTRGALEVFIRSVPATCTVIVDEAYMDLVDQAGVETVAGLVKSIPNMIVLRTFSKIHGLAGLRIGYGITPEALSKRFASLSLTWPNSTGVAAATASFNDREFLKTTRAALVGDRARIHAALDRMGLKRTEAQGNFVFFDTGGPLKRFQDRMLADGIKVGRHFDGYDTWARVSIGLHRVVDQFLAARPRAVAA